MDLNHTKIHFASKLGNSNSNIGDLSYGQAQNEVKFNFQVNFNIEGPDQLPSKAIGTLPKLFCTSGPNVVILAWMDDELSCGEAHGSHTHGHIHIHMNTETDAANDNSQRPKLDSVKNCV